MFFLTNYFKKILEELKSGGLPHCESDQDYEFVWVSQYEVGPYRTDFACLFYSEVTPFKRLLWSATATTSTKKTKNRLRKTKKGIDTFNRMDGKYCILLDQNCITILKKCVKELHDIYQGIFFEALERRHQLEGDEENA